MKLTGKQHDFAVAYVATGNATVAYRQVYSTKSMSDRAVSVEACRLVNHPKISLKLAELKEPVVNEAKVTMGEVIQSLREAAEIAKEMESATGLVAACRELARLSGLYPAKEHSHKVTTAIGFADRLAAQRKQRKKETTNPS